MKYKLIAVDFDGTILNDKKEISKRNRDCLEKLKLKGLVIVGVTARNLESVKNVCDISLFDYLVLNNGCSIYNTKSNKNTYINKLNKDVYSSIYNDIKDKAKEIDFCTINNYYIINNIGYKSSFRKEITNLSEIEEDVCRMNLFFDKNNLSDIKDLLIKKYNNLNIFLMDDKQIESNWLVVNPSNIDKRKTMEILCKNINIPIENIIFFGDGLNDIELLKNVGLGIAMENAREEVKRVAKDVTLSNELDGVAVYLERLFTK